MGAIFSHCTFADFSLNWFAFLSDILSSNCVFHMVNLSCGFLCLVSMCYDTVAYPSHFLSFRQLTLNLAFHSVAVIPSEY